MMIDPLEGIRLKTDRAKTIINNLDRCLRKFAQRKPYRVRVDEHLDKDGSIIGNLTAVKNPKISLDPNIVLMAGEDLYHLRSSLDHLVHQLVLLKDPSFDVQKKGRLQFPIFDSRGGYISRATGMIKGVSSLQASLIEGEQPYERLPHAPHEDNTLGSQRTQQHRQASNDSCGARLFRHIGRTCRGECRSVVPCRWLVCQVYSYLN